MRVGKPRVALPDLNILNAPRAVSSGTPEQIAGQLRQLPAFVTLDQRVVQTVDFAVRQAQGVDKSLVVVRGGDSRLDADGRPLTINPGGRVQFHGLETEVPRFLIRTSRDPSGRSNNHCEFARLDATGQSAAHVSIESCELSYSVGCQLEQYNGDGASLSISNASRPDDPSARHVATCSGHTFTQCGFGNYGQDGDRSTPPTLTDQWRGCCVRMHGMVERAVFDSCWFAGLGDATAMNIVALDVETWPGGGRVNWPRHIELVNCSGEGAHLIRLWGYGELRAEWQHGAKVVSALFPHGKDIWLPVVTLRGLSALSVEDGGFAITVGASDTDVFELPVDEPQPAATPALAAAVGSRGDSYAAA